MSNKNELLKHLFNTIDVNDVLVQKNGKLFIGNDELTERDVQILVEEATIFRNTFLYKVIMNNIKFVSNQRMFEQAKVYDDLLFGKACLYTLDLIRQIVTNLSSPKVDTPKKETKKKKVEK